MKNNNKIIKKVKLCESLLIPMVPFEEIEETVNPFRGIELKIDINKLIKKNSGKNLKIIESIMNGESLKSITKTQKTSYKHIKKLLSELKTQLVG
jgi:hypothetical protein